MHVVDGERKESEWEKSRRKRRVRKGVEEVMLDAEGMTYNPGAY